MRDYVTTSDRHIVCFWKGQASYLDLEVDGKVNKDAAWYDPYTSPAARQIRDYVTFWRCVKVSA